MGRGSVLKCGYTGDHAAGKCALQVVQGRRPWQTHRVAMKHVGCKFTGHAPWERWLMGWLHAFFAVTVKVGHCLQHITLHVSLPSSPIIT